MPAFRAASLRKTPSKTDATAKSRRDWFASRTRPALRRSSSAENSVRVMLTVIDPTPQANQALQGITAPQLCEQLNESAHPTVGITMHPRPGPLSNAANPPSAWQNLPHWRAQVPSQPPGPLVVKKGSIAFP